MRRTTEILAGALLGLFTGILTGVSVNPVVATTLGALLALASAWAGIRGTAQASAASQSESVRLASFALLAVLGLGTGIYGRTHSILSPTPQELVQRWTDAGLSTQDAQRLAVSQLVGGEAAVLPRTLGEQLEEYRRAGLDSEQARTRLHDAKSGDPMKVTSGTSAYGTIAFSGEDAATFCEGLLAQRPTPEEELRRYRAQGGAWAALAEALERGEISGLPARLNAARTTACAANATP